MSWLLISGYRCVLKTSCRPSEPVLSLVHEPVKNAHGVIAITKDVIARRQAMLGAILLHFIQLLDVKFMVAYHTPVMGRRIHGKAWGKRTIGADD